MDAATAYLSDPMFRRMVDVIETMLHQAEMTPSEVRAAATFACIRYEQKTVRPLFVPSLPPEARKP
jgi:hypothetical protein